MGSWSKSVGRKAWVPAEKPLDNRERVFSFKIAAGRLKVSIRF